MPVAIALGGDPAALLAACAPLAPGADRWALAGLLREKPVELVACRQVDLKVPAGAEIVIEGTIDTAAPPTTAGPRVMPGRFYTHAEQAPAVDVAAVTHRVNPVLPAMVPGGPPCESLIVERAMWRMLMPAIKLAIPEMVDLRLPLFGCVRHWAIASIRKWHAGQARRVAQAVWGLAQSRSAKLLVVVDEDVDAADTEQVLAAMAANVRPRRDVWFGDGPPDPLDPASPPGVLGQRMAIDATRKLPGEREGELPRSAATAEEIARLVSRRWAEYGLGPEPEGG
jgi:4-hydroxy-3-polyprenylbenzoate decarboxylase